MNNVRSLILATVLAVNGGPISYPSCSFCHTKLQEESTGNSASLGRSLMCQRCKKSIPPSDVNHRFRVSLCIAEDSTECDVTIFGSCLDKVLGAPAETFVRFEDKLLQHGFSSNQVQNLIAEVFSSCLIGQKYYFGFRIPKTAKGKTLKYVVETAPSCGIVAHQIVTINDLTCSAYATLKFEAEKLWRKDITDLVSSQKVEAQLDKQSEDHELTVSQSILDNRSAFDFSSMSSISYSNYQSSLGLVSFDTTLLSQEKLVTPSCIRRKFSSSGEKCRSGVKNRNASQSLLEGKTESTQSKVVDVGLEHSHDLDGMQKAWDKSDQRERKTFNNVSKLPSENSIESIFSKVSQNSHIIEMKRRKSEPGELIRCNSNESCPSLIPTGTGTKSNISSEKTEANLATSNVESHVTSATGVSQCANSRNCNFLPPPVDWKCKSRKSVCENFSDSLFSVDSQTSDVTNHSNSKSLSVKSRPSHSLSLLGKKIRSSGIHYVSRASTMCDIPSEILSESLFSLGSQNCAASKRNAASGKEYSIQSDTSSCPESSKLPKSKLQEHFSESLFSQDSQLDQVLVGYCCQENESCGVEVLRASKAGVGTACTLSSNIIESHDEGSFSVEIPVQGAATGLRTTTNNITESRDEGSFSVEIQVQGVARGLITTKSNNTESRDEGSFSVEIPVQGAATGLRTTTNNITESRDEGSFGVEIQVQGVARGLITTKSNNAESRHEGSFSVEIPVQGAATGLRTTTNNITESRDEGSFSVEIPVQGVARGLRNTKSNNIESRNKGSFSVEIPVQGVVHVNESCAIVQKIAMVKNCTPNESCSQVLYMYSEEIPIQGPGKEGFVVLQKIGTEENRLKKDSKVTHFNDGKMNGGVKSIYSAAYECSEGLFSEEVPFLDVRTEGRGNARRAKIRNESECKMNEVMKDVKSIDSASDECSEGLFSEELPSLKVQVVGIEACNAGKANIENESGDRPTGGELNILLNNVDTTEERGDAKQRQKPCTEVFKKPIVPNADRFCAKINGVAFKENNPTKLNPESFCMWDLLADCSDYVVLSDDEDKISHKQRNIPKCQKILDINPPESENLDEFLGKCDESEYHGVDLERTKIDKSVSHGFASNDKKSKSTHVLVVNEDTYPPPLPESENMDAFLRGCDSGDSEIADSSFEDSKLLQEVFALEHEISKTDDTEASLRPVASDQSLDCIIKNGLNTRQDCEGQLNASLTSRQGLESESSLADSILDSSFDLFSQTQNSQMAEGIIMCDNNSGVALNQGQSPAHVQIDSGLGNSGEMGSQETSSQQKTDVMLKDVTPVPKSGNDDIHDTTVHENDHCGVFNKQSNSLWKATNTSHYCTSNTKCTNKSEISHVSSVSCSVPTVEFSQDLWSQDLFATQSQCSKNIVSQSQRLSITNRNDKILTEKFSGLSKSRCDSFVGNGTHIGGEKTRTKSDIQRNEIASCSPVNKIADEVVFKTPLNTVRTISFRKSDVSVSMNRTSTPLLGRNVADGGIDKHPIKSTRTTSTASHYDTASNFVHNIEADSSVYYSLESSLLKRPSSCLKCRKSSLQSSASVKHSKIFKSAQWEINDVKNTGRSSPRVRKTVRFSEKSMCTEKENLSCLSDSILLNAAGEVNIDTSKPNSFSHKSYNQGVKGDGRGTEIDPHTPLSNMQTEGHNLMNFDYSPNLFSSMEMSTCFSEANETNNCCFTPYREICVLSKDRPNQSNKLIELEGEDEFEDNRVPVFSFDCSADLFSESD